MYYFATCLCETQFFYSHECQHITENLLKSTAAFAQTSLQMGPTSFPVHVKERSRQTGISLSRISLPHGRANEATALNSQVGETFPKQRVVCGD